MIYKNQIILIFILSISAILIDCGKQNDGSQKVISKCDTVNKRIVLAQEILNKKYIYALQELNKSGVEFLVSEGYVEAGKILIGYDSTKVISVHKDSVKIDSVSNIRFYDFELNNDSTKVKLTVAYFALGNQLAKITHFKYEFDTLNCKWTMNDSSSSYFK